MQLSIKVRQQTLYILQVLPSGCFVKVQSIGPHCNDDDQLFLEMFQEKERSWQEQYAKVRLTPSPVQPCHGLVSIVTGQQRHQQAPAPLHAMQCHVLVFLEVWQQQRVQQAAVAGNAMVSNSLPQLQRYTHAAVA